LAASTKGFLRPGLGSLENFMHEIASERPGAHLDRLGRRRFWLVAILALAAMLLAAPERVRAEEPPDPDAERLRKELFDAMDAFDRHGHWRDSDSGVLAWSCGQQLQTAVYLYQATGQREWLDRLFKYAEAMFSNLSPRADGFLCWRTRRYIRPPPGPRGTAATGPAHPGFDFAVHDGMVLMPICRAIELVKKDEALTATYGQRADKLLAVVVKDLIPKWDSCWRETKDGAVLVFHDDPLMGDGRGITMPHNQYLPLGIVQITLFRITGRPVYKERAAKMARFFKSRLRLVNDRYEWNYWDPAGQWDKDMVAKDKPRAEDTGHGSLDVAFVISCVDNNIIFTRADLRRLANTFVEAMWNGSMDKPTVGGWVNRTNPSRQSGNLASWVLLSRVEPKVGRICRYVIRTEGGLWAKAELYWLLMNRGVKDSQP